ncbi:MAG: prolyl oligopeptidase family serine peptidase [Nitrospirota bacterium]
MLDEFLENIMSGYRVDQDRIYLTGISMGGYGVWRTAIEYPDRFAAIAPVCGGGNVRFTVYPDGGHDSSTGTYNNPELYRWFLQHRRHAGVGA